MKKGHESGDITGEEEHKREEREKKEEERERERENKEREGKVAGRVRQSREPALGFTDHVVFFVVEARFLIHSEDHTLFFVCVILFLFSIFFIVVAVTSCAKRILALEPLIK
jgi:hypothetical protein